MNKRQKKKVYKHNFTNQKMLERYFKSHHLHLIEGEATSIILCAKRDNEKGELYGCHIQITLKDLYKRIFELKQRTDGLCAIVLTDSFFKFDVVRGRYLLTNPIPYYAYSGGEKDIYSPYLIQIGLPFRPYYE